MALVVNRWTEEVLTDIAEAGDYSEALDSMVVKAGWYDDLRTGESTLIEEKNTGLNQFGYIIRRIERRFTYDVPGTPPLFFEEDTYAKAYLPGVDPGRHERLVETKRAEYHPWTMFQQGSPNLSRKIITAGWVIYDMTPDGTGLTAEQKQKLVDKGLNPDGPPKLIVDSARRWDEANHYAETVEDDATPQVAKWLVFESEYEIVFEEVDKYTIYTYRKNHLRPQDMRVDGPRHQRKPNYTYRLNVAIEPPEIEATVAGDDGIRVTVTKGGATVVNTRVQPERYRILRRTVTGGNRPPDDDPFDLYDTAPTPPPAARLWTDTAVTDLAGAPASATPDPTPYNEPGDSTEEPGEEWTVLGDYPNEHPQEPEGYASILDTDVVNNSTYEYVATALIGSDESAPCSPASVQWGGATKKGKITAHVRRVPEESGDGAGDLEIDVLAPDPQTYGETIKFEIPADILEDDAAEFGEAIGRRHFAEDLDPALAVNLDVTIPLVILERGQKIRTPAIDWTTTGNGLIITSETETRDWLLEGFRIRASRSGAGADLEIRGTTLYLAER